MFIETSALVSILLREPGWEALLEAMNKAQLAITSPLVILESCMVISSRLAIPPDFSEAQIRRLLENAQVAVAPMDDTTATLAIQAFQTFGKGRGHPAQLNMGDCFSHACATQHKLPLLYVGDDFAQTDLG
jgi:ribonuclease VapC